MSRDWRDDQAYDHFDSLDLSGLAWECLRRNEDYCADYERRPHRSMRGLWFAVSTSIATNRMGSPLPDHRYNQT